MHRMVLMFGADRSTFSFVHNIIIKTESDSIRANPHMKINFIFLNPCWYDTTPHILQQLCG